MARKIKKKFDRPKKGPSEKISDIRGRHFFLTVPHFEGTVDTVIAALKTFEPHWEYIRYAAVLETHTNDAEKSNHLHLYVCYPKLQRVRLDRFDYLGKHGKVEKVRDYRSVLKYMTKEARPRANFDYIEEILRKDLTRGVEILLSQGFHIREIYKNYSSIVASKNWSGYLRFLQYSKDSEKFLEELRRPGLRMITKELIKARLSDQQYREYYSKPIYSRIIDRINDIVRYGSHRPHKARALFLTGAPNTGKTTLGLALAAKVGTFTFPDDGWFQGYESDVFKLIIWNEFDLRRFQYPTLLKFLEGLRMDLPIKGSHVTRSDNPLIYLTSNLTLEDLICKRFESEENRAHSRANLAVRIDEVDIGTNPIFFLFKLLVAPTEDINESFNTTT